MLRLLVDENLPRSLTTALREAGHEVWDIRELGLRGISDDQIFRQAQELGAALLSADKGFGNVLRFPPASHLGIVVVRLPSDMSVAELCRVVVGALQGLEPDELQGHLCIVRPGQVRFRPARGGEE